MKRGQVSNLNIGDNIVVDVKGKRMVAEMVTKPDAGGNLKVKIAGVERETNITKLSKYKGKAPS